MIFLGCLHGAAMARQAQTVRNYETSHKIDYVPNSKGFKNCIVGSKVSAILQDLADFA